MKMRKESHVVNFVEASSFEDKVGRDQTELVSDIKSSIKNKQAGA